MAESTLDQVRRLVAQLSHPQAIAIVSFPGTPCEPHSVLLSLIMGSTARSRK